MGMSTEEIKKNIIKKQLTEGLKQLQVVKKPVVVNAYELKEDITVETLEGTMRGKKGDYLMFGVENEPYICQRDIFHKTYRIFDEYQNELDDLQEKINQLMLEERDLLEDLQLRKMIEYELILRERMRKSKVGTTVFGVGGNGNVKY